jgi:dipeptidyl aminopeptidase/acylaminoacyl peptidase
MTALARMSLSVALPLVSWCAAVGPASAAFPGQNGKIVFYSDRDLPQQEIYAMDPNGMNQTRLTNNMATDAEPVCSPDGRKIAFWSTRDGNNEIYLMDANGMNQKRLTTNMVIDYKPAWSPDGSKIAFASLRNNNTDIYVVDANGMNETRLTNNASVEVEPAWSPDGKKIAFTSSRDGDDEIFVMDANGMNQMQLTTNATNDDVPNWSPDGTKIAFAAERGGNIDIYMMDANGMNEMRLTTAVAADNFPAWSPDGTMIAFVSARDNNLEIYTMDVNGMNQTNRTSNPGNDVHPDWCPAVAETALDHFKCYTVREVESPRFEPQTVTLFDQFAASTTATVVRPNRFCNPADKNDEGINDPTRHLMCYRLREGAGTRREVRVRNQFGDQILTVGRPESLCNPADKDGVPRDSDTNHFKCYRVRGRDFTTVAANVADQFEIQTTMLVRPRLLCNPVVKDASGIVDAAAHLTCYTIKPGLPAFTPQDVTVMDQFAEQDLRALRGECRRRSVLCVPSEKNPPSPSGAFLDGASLNRALLDG